MIAAAALTVSYPQSAEARPPSGRVTAREINIPELPLPRALSELSRQTGVSIGSEGALPPVRTKPVRGRLSAGEALRRMLKGLPFEARLVGETAWRIVPRNVARQGSNNQVRQARPEQAPETVDPIGIVVSANKFPNELIDIPRSIGLILPDSLQQVSADSGTAAMTKDLQGISVAGGGGGRNQIFLRGVADSPFAGMNQATVAVLMDGVRMTYSAPDPDLRLVDVKRAELLKGPQGSLYGLGVLGGIYQVVTNSPDISSASASIGLGLSQVAGGSLGQNGAAVVNLPLVPEVMALRLVGYGSHAGGWVHTGVRRDANGLDTYGGRLALGLELGQDWRLDVKGAAQKLRSADSQYVYAAGSRSRPDQIPEPSVNQFEHAALQLKGRLGGIDIVALSGQTWQRTSEQLDATVGAGSFGLYDPAKYIDTRNYKVWDSELRFSGTWKSIDLLGGISHVEARRHMDRHLYAIDPATSAEIDHGQRTSLESAVFGNATLKLGAGFSVQGGGRLFRAKIREDRQQGSAANAIEVSETGFTPEAAFSWRPYADRMVYLRYGSAFRLSGLGISSPLFDQDCVEEDDCGEVETSPGDNLKTIEVGWKEQFVRGGSLDASVYYTAWSNLQSTFLASNGLTESGTVGDARIIGAEIALNLPLGLWHLALGAAFQDARLVHVEFASLDDEEKRLPVVPRFTGAIAMKRHFQLGNVKGWLQTSIRYIGPARLSFDPRLDREMGNYIDAGIEGRISLGALEFGIDVKNVLAKGGNTYALGNQFRAETMRQYMPQVPASIIATVGFRF